MKKTILALSILTLGLVACKKEYITNEYVTNEIIQPPADIEYFFSNGWRDTSETNFKIIFNAFSESNVVNITGIIGQGYLSKDYTYFSLNIDTTLPSWSQNVIIPNTYPNQMNQVPAYFDKFHIEFIDRINHKARVYSEVLGKTYNLIEL